MTLGQSISSGCSYKARLGLFFSVGMLLLLLFSVSVSASGGILLRSDSGQWLLYQVDGINSDDGVILSGLSANTDWELQALADLNGDGESDLLLRNGEGSWFGYLIKSQQVLAQQALTLTGNSDWVFKVAQDFNGDGNADVLLRKESSGAWFVYLMNGLSILQSGSVNITANLRWEFQGAGDFYGDGSSDVLMRNLDNQSWLLYSLDGLTVTDWGLIRFGLNPRWQFAVADDFTGDGKADMIMRRDDGPWWLYEVDGRTVQLNENFGILALTANLNWQLQGTPDFNGDGRADVLLRHVGTGRWFNYPLDGRTKVDVDSGFVGATDDTGWSFIGLGQLPANSTDATLTYFQNNISDALIQSKCVVCHISGGLAAASRLNYVPSSTDDYQQTNYNLINEFVSTVDGGAELILSKVKGVAHGGGVQLPSSSDEYTSLETFLGLLTGNDSSGSNSQAFMAGVTAISPLDTLRRSAIILAGRLPTDEEEDALINGGVAALPEVIRGLMAGEGFHQFLVEGANDRLLTDRAIFNGAEIYDDAHGFYPDMVNQLYDLRIQGEFDEAWRQHSLGRYGMARAPVELIAYVVENELPYSEILTADYAMFNPFSNAHLRGTAIFENSQDIDEFQPGIMRGQIRKDASFQYDYDLTLRGHYLGGGLETNYPHAGVLNALAFLDRYPTTETNRNRARARWTYYHFLGVDIEKSAARTNDPEALADTNNPTLNNANCTVCHQTMDPVAGAFQNYSNEGFYRGAWGGNDSLPDNYKWPLEGERLYVEGDTWFRDMRTPGFEGATAPNPDNSLQWLANKIVSDPRFLTATIRFWWPAVMGVKALEVPEDAQDVNYESQLVAFEAQSADIESFAQDFAVTMNLKDLLVAMVLSDWFRAGEVGALTSERELQLADVGIEKLLTPLQLKRKMKEITGHVWDEYFNTYYEKYSSALTEAYRIYMGGIDSAGVTERATATNTLLYQTVATQAMNTACAIVGLDINRPDGQRKLFNGLDRNLAPTGAGSSSHAVTGADESEMLNYQLSVSLEDEGYFVRIAFTNDYYTEEEGDRNLLLRELRVHDANDNVVRTYALNDTSNLTGGSSIPEGQGSINGSTFFLWSNGYIEILIEGLPTGNYTFEVDAFGQQAGDDYPEMVISVHSESPYGDSTGAMAIKERIQLFHALFLNEYFEINDPEITATYQLFVESWQDFNESGVDGWMSADLACTSMPPKHDWENNNWTDPYHILNSWMVVVAYLMSDYKFVHE